MSIMGSKARSRSDRHSHKEQQTSWQRTSEGELVLFLQRIAASVPSPADIVVVCIGTDRSSGDSFGPWVGTILEQLGWPHVIGTMEVPCDADHYEAMTKNLPADKTIIAIDASLGRSDYVGGFLIAEGPLHPARATGKNLAPIGHYSLAGVVAPLSPRAYWSLQRASLYQVMRMAQRTAEAFAIAWGGQASASGESLAKEVFGSDPAALVRFIR